jgi:tetratricopeptide (TPR) repeat protein
MMNNYLRYTVFISIMILVLSCAAVPRKEVVTPEVPPPPEKKLPIAEQEKKSWQTYEEILNMTANVDRRTILPQMEAGYWKIINEYPDTYLAQESYLRLITMNLEDYSPPKIEKAEKLYKEFVEKYPDSRVKMFIDDIMARFYYNSRLWEKLLDFCTPHVKEYLKTGTLKTPLFLFFYSEAKFNLDDLKEAEKGYKIIRRLFPKSMEARISKKRLEEIKKQ